METLLPAERPPLTHMYAMDGTFAVTILYVRPSYEGTVRTWMERVARTIFQVEAFSLRRSQRPRFRLEIAIRAVAQAAGRGRAVRCG